MPREISGERKLAYYVGMVIMGVGLLLFFSVFASFALNFGNFDHFPGQMKSFAIRAFGGMALLMLGGVIRGIGARGLAGSGVVLDPQRARGELEPYTRMAGGMVKDALDEADVSLGGRSEQVIMIKCRECGRLNEENSKFCQECGQEL
ncbi:MAG: zinc-ribbon domain-containing protein [Nitrospiraceae bacterium]|nr:zinc-ribbon domain-containing protein [Nitrospiraceae bacterium]